MPSPLDFALLSVIVLLVAAVAATLLKRFQGLLIVFTSVAVAAASLMGAGAGFYAVLGATREGRVVPLGLPDLPFRLGLDPLSGFFLAVTGMAAFFVSVYSAGYLRGIAAKRPVTRLAAFYCLFIAGMFLVLLADDAFLFMTSWEVMAASSFFLVAFEDESTEARKAAFIYFLVAHVGAVLILLSFGLAAGFATGFEDFSGYAFSAMRGSGMPQAWRTAAFLLAFVGFAAKAGVVPLHVWLPEAHPAAPTNVSALMSGVMLKTAVYGIIRMGIDILGPPVWWWGAIVLTAGLVSALVGVLHAMMQNDIKRLLAYSSVENIGIILVCVGLSMIFRSFGMDALSALALVAGLYHTLNHAAFKGLLFMGAGSVVHATGERNMERMGGLIHAMPWTSALFLVGCVSIAALPPLNGFVSEWLTFQSFLLSPALPSPLLDIIIPLGAAIIALSGTLAAACFVKAYGVVFLGHWRGDKGHAVHEASWSMRAGMALAALMCLGLGLMPGHVIGWLNNISVEMVGAGIGESAREFGWMWLTPVSAERASYSAPMVLLCMASVVAAVFLLAHARRKDIRRAPLWDCGFEKVTERMQYTSTAFSMPFRRIFGFLFSVKETARPSGGRKAWPFTGGFTYQLRLRDRTWHALYTPIADAAFRLAKAAGRLQHGRIQIYLMYSFITLIILLVFS
jgi:formate hydrogenlyase subunit 3/multisubunit Na+/H+ antiporter MnhD subunit